MRRLRKWWRLRNSRPVYVSLYGSDGEVAGQLVPFYRGSNVDEIMFTNMPTCTIEAVYVNGKEIPMFFPRTLNRGQSIFWRGEEFHIG
jgi:hypothetical protein